MENRKTIDKTKEIKLVPREDKISKSFARLTKKKGLGLVPQVEPQSISRCARPPPPTVRLAPGPRLQGPRAIGTTHHDLDIMRAAMS